MSEPSQSSVSNEEKKSEDVFKILVATDNHLGYAEDDKVRGMDTFNTLEEIFQLATAEEVDFVLLGGDLFHHPKPSPFCINKCMEIFKKYCLGDKPVQIEFLSNPSLNFPNAQVNYEDPNLNIGLPVFSIHGNHDDPSGTNSTSTLDLLSSCGLLNYFGICHDLDQIDITPILLRKGKTNLALYGLSHIRDERLGRLFLDKKVKILQPRGEDDVWFNLLVWHQNRAARSTKNYIPDDNLPDKLDLVIWGHEHDCRIVPERKQNGVHVSQPGSSVATSLADGEAIPKQVGILEIYKKHFKMRPIDLKSVRPFRCAELVIKHPIYTEDNEDKEYIKHLITNTIDRMIHEAKNMGNNEEVSKKPLIRLNVKYKDEDQVFNAIKFGQTYANEVANPEDMLRFQLLKEPVRRAKTGKKSSDGEQEEEEELVGPVIADRVEDLVSLHFSQEDSLTVFPLKTLNETVKKFVDSNDSRAIEDVREYYLKEVFKKLEVDLPETDDFENYLVKFKRNMEKDGADIVNQILSDPKRSITRHANGHASTSAVDDDDESVLTDDDDEDGGSKKKASQKPTRGKGNRGARKATAARAPRQTNKNTEKVSKKNKAKYSSNEEDLTSEPDDDVHIIEDDSDNGGSKKPARGRGSRGGRKAISPKGKGKGKTRSLWD